MNYHYIRNIDPEGYYQQQKLSNSLIKQAVHGLEEFKYAWDTVTLPKKPTESMIFGNVCHTLLLEPEEYTRRYVTSPFDSFRSNEAKAWKKEAEGAGLIVIKKEGLEKSDNTEQKAMAMIQALTETDYVHSDLVAKMKYIFELPDLEIEKEFYWIDPVTQRQCKAKLDAYSPSENIVIDYKTIENLWDHKVKSNFGEYRYDLSCAQYSEAIKHCEGKSQYPSFIFIVQEKKAPFRFKIMTPNAAMLQSGFSKREELLKKIDEAFTNNSFFTSTEVEEIEMPSWIS
jgi:hypothetical protein